VAGHASLYYDELGRLLEYYTSVSTRFQFDGAQVAAEPNSGTNAITNRFVWGDNPDELLVWYQGSDTAIRRFISADERGSVIAASDEHRPDPVHLNDCNGSEADSSGRSGRVKCGLGEP
jgi:hypothetical protein